VSRTSTLREEANELNMRAYNGVVSLPSYGAELTRDVRWWSGEHLSRDTHLLTILAHTLSHSLWRLSLSLSSLSSTR
jgi:hypothetical protein